MNNSLPLPLAVGYTDPSHQNWKQDFRHGDYSSFQLISPNDRLLPFQYRRPSVPSISIDIKLYNALNDGFLYNLSTFIVGSEINIQSRGIVDYVTYFGQIPFLLNYTLDCGIYYIGVDDGTNDEIYSEIFVVLEGTNTGTDYLSANDDTYIIFNDDQLIIV